jgi:pilus assembly protein Flp/PilA
MLYAKYQTLKSRFELSDIGASMVEYALLVVLIAIVAIVAVTLAGSSLSSTYSDISSNLADANSH